MSRSDNNGSGAPMDFDAEGIPILNEVVEFTPFEQAESILDELSDLVEEPGLGLNLPIREQMLAALRARLKKELHAELDGLIEEATITAVAHASATLEREIQAHLRRILESRLSEMIEQSVDDAL